MTYPILRMLSHFSLTVSSLCLIHLFNSIVRRGFHILHSASVLFSLYISGDILMVIVWFNSVKLNRSIPAFSPGLLCHFWHFASFTSFHFNCMHYLSRGRFSFNSVIIIHSLNFWCFTVFQNFRYSTIGVYLHDIFFVFVSFLNDWEQFFALFMFHYLLY